MIKHYQIDYYKGILGIYNRKIMTHFIRLGELWNRRLILDFGCGVGHLRTRVQNVVGYDINPELSDIEDYKSMKPEVIVAAASLQYLNPKQMDDFLQFAIKSKAELVTVIPTENIAAKLAMIILNKPYAHDDHLFGYKHINRILEKHFKVKKRKYLCLSMVQLTIYD